jgi:hypothetical protein
MRPRRTASITAPGTPVLGANVACGAAQPCPPPSDVVRRTPQGRPAIRVRSSRAADILTRARLVGRAATRTSASSSASRRGDVDPDFTRTPLFH